MALFEQFGNVTSAVVQFDEEGRSKGFGFVNFDTHEEAQKAVDSLHETDFKDRKLFVSRAQKKAEREEREREEAAARKAAEEDAARVAAAEKAAERKRKWAEPEDVIPG